MESSPSITTTEATTTVEAEATIAVRDIKYPFPPHMVGIGVPYLHTETGLRRIKNKKVVVRESNGLEVVAIVGKNFALVPNEVVEEMVDKAITAYGLTKLKRSTDKYENTLRIDLLTDKVKEVEVGDIVQFGVSVRNSIDGTSALAVDLFSYRLKCKNGATARDTDMSYSVRHIGDARELLKYFNRALGEVMERFDTLLSLYRKMAITPLTKEGAEKIVALRFPEKYYKYTPIMIKDGEEIELRRHDSTLWDTFNAITNVVTHESRASPLARSYMTHRLHRVMQSLVSSASA